MKAPYFSVVIPAYNVESYIEETITSVLRQTFNDWELLVVDDGSTDRTREKLGAFKDERIRVLTIPNGGVSRARNLGIEKAAGKFIAFLDGDDVWHPGHLSRAYEYLSSHKDVAWYASRYVMGERIDQLVTPAPTQVVERLYYGTPALHVHSSTVVLCAEYAKELLPLFPEDMKNAEDWAAWTTYAEYYPTIAFTETQDVLYRKREGSATAGGGDALSHLFFALPDYWVTRIRRDQLESQQQCYYRYRTTQRWQLRVSRMIIDDWKGKLRRHRPYLGLLRYFLLWGVLQVVSSMVLMLSKLLYMLTLRDESLLSKE